MKPLIRYWFTFAKTANQCPLNIGCGVTASSYEDALELLRERLGPEDLVRVVGYVEGVDISTLDPGHLLPNMGVVSNRGIWFPLA